MPDQIPNEDIAYARAELERIDSYGLIYRKTHPFPEPKKLNFVQALGIEAFATLLSGVGGVILAAVRTATIFYLTEQSLLVTYSSNLGVVFKTLVTILPTLAMFSALFAVEGYVFSRGLSIGRSKKDSRNAPWGMVFAIGISIVAGVAASLPLIKNLSETSLITIIIQWTLAVTTGIGATVLAYYGAENLGTIFVRWELMQLEAVNQYAELVKSWNEKMQIDYRSRGRTAIFGLEKYTTKNIEKEAEQENVDTNVIERIREWLASNGMTAFDVGGDRNIYGVTPADVAKALSLHKLSSVRAALFRLRKADDQSKPRGE
jgi:hypothetical protein